MRKYISTFAAITAVASGVAVLLLKMSVQAKTEDIQALVAKIHADQEAMRVLEAEWSYVSAPRRLQENSVKFLALMPPTAEQIISTPDAIPMRPRGIDVTPPADVLLPSAHKKPDADEKLDIGSKGNSSEYDL